jgi:hypothetical protein
MATTYFSKEERVIEALNIFNTKEFPSLRAAATYYGAPYRRTLARYNDRVSRLERKLINRLLSKEEENSLYIYVDRLNKLGTRPL